MRATAGCRRPRPGASGFSLLLAVAGLLSGCATPSDLVPLQPATCPFPLSKVRITKDVNVVEGGIREGWAQVREMERVKGKPTRKLRFEFAESWTEDDASGHVPTLGEPYLIWNLDGYTRSAPAVCVRGFTPASGDEPLRAPMA